MTAPLPPIVPGVPLLGSIPDLIRDYPTLLLKKAPATGDLVRVKAGTMEMYIVSHPDYLQHIMRDEHKKYARGGEGAGGLMRVIGRGLIALEGEEWLNERRMMQPYFHRQYLPRLVELMAETIDAELDRVEGYADAGEVDFAPIIKRLTLSVFLNAMYGFGLSDEMIDELTSTIDDAMRYNGQRDKLSAIIPKSIKLPLDKKVDEAVARFDEIVDEIIQMRRDSDIEESDLLGLLLNATDEDGKGMSPQQLRDEVKTLIIGGYDTTTGSLLWSLYLLAQHPEAAQKIIEEADRIIDGQLTMEMVGDLKYARMVFDETLRLKPVSWANNRVCIEDDEMGGYRIPAGTMILVPVMSLHRDPRFWDDPESFKPERWEENNGGAKHRFAYMPFGMGPRVCLGQHFSLLEATMILSKLIKRFDITPVQEEPENVSFDFTMAPIDAPMTVRVRKPRQLATPMPV